MQIGIDASRLAVNQRTGTEHYTWELLAALGRLDRRHSWSLYTNGRPKALPPLPPNFHLCSIPWPRLWTHARLSAEMLKSAPDLLFVPAHVLPLVHPRRSVVTIHDLGYIHYPAAHPRAQRWYLRLSTLWSARLASHLIADSEATKRDLVRFCGVAPDKISVVYLGVSERFTPGVDREVLARYGIRTPYLLFVGTVQPRKNLARLIDAFALANLAGLTLVIVGKRGWLTTAIEGRAAARGIADRVHFTGYIIDADLPAVLSGATGLLMPSLYEGFGLPALEAMACATPVVVSEVASLPEVVGDAGILVDPLDVNDIARGLVELVGDEPRRAVLRERGLARAARFTWRACAEHTLSVLERVGLDVGP